MTAQRSTFDHEPDVLLGMSVEEARSEAARLAALAQSLTDHLSRVHYSTSSVVGRNLTRERDRLEWDSAGILSRIAEHEGQIQRVREAGPVPSARAALVRRRKQEAAR